MGLEIVKARASHPGMVEDIPGWLYIILDLDYAISEIFPEYRVFQVKEKFGGLRYYIGGVPPDKYDAIHSLIRAAEALSFKTCDTCGAPGTVRNDRPWVRTLCDEHAAGATS